MFSPLDQDTLKIIDSFFNSRFAFYQLNESEIELYSIFPWNHDFNSDDIQIMFEDLQKEIMLKYYIPKQYIKTPIKFLNYVFKQIHSLKYYYLKPYSTIGIFRTYYLEQR